MGTQRRGFLKQVGGSAVMFGLSDFSRILSVLLGGEAADAQLSGQYVEGCNCSMPCPCPMLANFKEHCTGAFALVLESALVGSTDFSGVKVAWAGRAGEEIYVYVDAPRPMAETARAFARDLFSDFGKILTIRDTRIEVAGGKGKYTLAVDGGRILELVTEPVLGADGRTPIRIVNSLTEWLPTIMQGRTLRGSYRDGTLSFNLSNSNAFFHDEFRYRGSLPQVRAFEGRA